MHLSHVLIDTDNIPPRIHLPSLRTVGTDDNTIIDNLRDDNKHSRVLSHELGIPGLSGRKRKDDELEFAPTKPKYVPTKDKEDVSGMFYFRMF